MLIEDIILWKVKIRYLQDPHFVGKASGEELITEGFVKWRHTSEFCDSSFYNLCLPQLAAF